MPRMPAKNKRYYPVERIFRIRESTGALNGLRRIEANRLASMANRRLYRQSYIYSMKIDVDIDSALATAGVKVFVLRNGWDMHGAYRWAMKNYYNTMKEELQMGGAKTRWHDFRVSAGLSADVTVPTEFDFPSGAVSSMGTANAVASGDFDYSRVVDSDGNTKTFVLEGNSSATQYSIVKEWQRKDRVDPDPSASEVTLSYDGINHENDEENYDILRDNGAAPPYGQNASTSPFVQIAELKQTASGAQKLTTGFFDAPLGLVIIESTAIVQQEPIAPQNLPVVVTLQSGNYKGVKATPYATPVLTEAKEYEVV